MSKVHCRCGQSIDPIPYPQEQWFSYYGQIPGEWWTSLNSAIAGTAARDAEQISLKVAAALGTLGRTFVKCPTCGRLMVWWDDGPQARYYVPEAQHED